MITQELAHLWRFIKRPSFKRLPTSNPKANDFWRGLHLGKAICYTLIAWLVMLLLVAPVTYLTAQQAGLENKIETVASTQSALFIVFLGVIRAPILEEIIFRYGLRRPLAWVFVAPLAFYGFFYVTGYLQFAILVAAMVVVAYVVQRLFQTPSIRFGSARAYRRCFPYIMYGGVIVFGAIHAANYIGLSGKLLFLIPLLVLPQLILGVVLAWLRVTHGLAMVMLVHAMYNAGPILLLVFVKQAAL